MPLQIQRTATVYRMWNDSDLRECFAVHADAGWVSSLVCAKDGASLVWGVRLQNADLRQQVAATLDDVVVSDGVTVQAFTVAAYNDANPDNLIEVGS